MPTVIDSGVAIIFKIAIITAWGRAYQQKWLRKDEWH